MLIRHIAIPRHSQLAALRQPTEKQNLEESRQYSNYLNRTLNPEIPIDDVLVSHTPTYDKGTDKISHRLQSSSKQAFLMKEYPQKLQDFTNAQIQLPQQSQKQPNPKQFQKNNHNSYRIRENWSSLMPYLSNKAYINLKQRNFSSLQVTSNEPYLSSDIKETHVLLSRQEDEDDQRLVNLHARPNNKNWEVYRTVERFRSRKLLNQQQEGRLKSKKYNLVLPKNNEIHSKDTKKEHQHQKQGFFQTKDEADLPLNLKRTQPFNLQQIKAESRSQSSCFPQNNKKKSIPADDQIKYSRNERFQNKFKSRSCRKTSQEESIIHAKPFRQNFTNQKRRQTILIKYNQESTHPQQIQISYRVSLAQLKNICAIPNIHQCELIMKIPQIFAVPLFSGNEQEGQLFAKAAQLIKHLQIRVKSDISIKKYTNCLLILAGNIAVVWYYHGKIYFGGWKHQHLDEGCKHGLGLEWVSQKFVYYGQFAKNKRQGIGIMKNSNNEVLSGVWRENKFMRPLPVSLDLKPHGQLN